MGQKHVGVSIKRAALENEAVMSKLDANTQQKLRTKPSSLRSIISILSFAFCIVGGIGSNSTVNLFDTAQAKKAGISDFEQGMKLTNDAIITGIRLSYASVAPGNVVVGDKPYTNLLFSRTTLAAGGVDMDAGAAGVQSTPVPARTIPNELLNCKLRLLVNDTERFAIDVADLFIENDRKDYQNGDFDDFYSLQEQLLLVPKGASVTVKLSTADGVAVSNAVNHFFKWSVLVSQFDEIA